MGGGSPGARRVVGGVLTAAAVAGLIYAASLPRAPEPVAPAPAAPDAPPAGPQADGRAEAEKAAAPAFDLVRVEQDGSAVVAGTAAPGAKVTIYADDAPLAVAEADAEGNFVAIFAAKPSAKPQALTLGAAMPDGGAATSDDVVMLLPAAPLDAQPAGEPEREVAAATPEVAATVIIREDAVEVTPAEPGSPRQVTLASISYAEAGEVTLAGQGTAGAGLRAYVDGSLAHEGRVGADGRWVLELGDVAEGVYTLRIDQLGPDGAVASRVETPFQRDYPAPPLPRPGSAAVPGAGAGSVTVQPGHNLWTLARLHYGSGVMFTQIFTANRELIRDPDLIYPGQIFALPTPGAAN